ncbi:alpha/beta fold hydrolase [Streptomyces sp. LN785]|uniref:alpha/beta fold hydrolase n=1 Tax=Streptomyces sp. LN785 TaxID=3112983 RepID=UPI003716EEBD
MGLLAVSALVLTACSSSEAGSIPGGSASARTEASFARLIDIGHGRKIYLECRGSGSPTVVLVPGLVAAADTWSYVKDSAGAMKPSGSAVYPRVGEFTRVCSYDRPGTARESGGVTTSTSVPQPTTPRGDVADLRAVLDTAGVGGPYVLAGWSAGGPVVRIFAAEHPHEVSGLVLVDAESEFLQSELTPAQFDTFLALIRNDDSKRVAQWKDVERQNPEKVFDQVRAAPAAPRIPVVVLSGDTFDPAAFRARLPAGAPAGFAQVFWRAQLASQERLAEQYPDAEHITKTRSDHNIHNNRPQLVVDAIHDVVEKVRGQQSGKPSPQ